MTPRERFSPDDPREWLNRARSNLALARKCAPDVYVEDLCFEAQQAAEKSIKAVMISHEIEFPYVHNLALLLSILEETGVTIPNKVRRAARLTPYAVDSRYPGVELPTSEEEYRDAVAVAEAVIQWAEEQL